jgi:hypothetical protein
MATPLARRPAADGASPQAVPAGPGAAGYAVPASPRGIGAQAAGALGLLTGLWVALSPWFITLQHGGSNATAVDLISGPAVAAVGAVALASPRGFSGLQLGSLLLGIWLIIAPPILDHKHPIAETISVVAAAIFLFLRAVLALVAALVPCGRARPPAQRRQRARSRPGSGRPARPGGQG